MNSIKSSLQLVPIIGAGWARFRRWQLHREYKRRRDDYVKTLSDRGLHHDEQITISDVRKRISDRGYVPIKRKINDIHTFAIIPQFSWHKHLLPDLLELGPVTLFDYVALGHDHKQRQIKKNAWQSGSTSRYTFAERNQAKAVLDVEIEKSREPVVKSIKLDSVRPMKQFDMTLNSEIQIFED